MSTTVISCEISGERTSKGGRYFLDVEIEGCGWDPQRFLEAGNERAARAEVSAIMDKMVAEGAVMSCQIVFNRDGNEAGTEATVAAAA